MSRQSLLENEIRPSHQVRATEVVAGVAQTPPAIPHSKPMVACRDNRTAERSRDQRDSRMQEVRADEAGNQAEGGDLLEAGVAGWGRVKGGHLKQKNPE